MGRFDRPILFSATTLLRFYVVSVAPEDSVLSLYNVVYIYSPPLENVKKMYAGEKKKVKAMRCTQMGYSNTRSTILDAVTGPTQETQ